MDYIKNSSETSKLSKPSKEVKTWLEFWEQKTGKKATRCGADGRHSADTLVGAHVKKVFGGNKLFITPLCYCCSQRRDSFWVDTELVRVPGGL